MLEGGDAEAEPLIKKHRRLSRLGLGLIFAGFFLQLIATWPR